MPTEASCPSPGRALVLGVNGQDGSYLAERLLRRGWTVVGSGVQPVSRWVAPTPHFEYRSLDLTDLSALSSLLRDARPDAIFHLAAVHGAAGFCYEDRWRDVHTVNTVSVHAILEYLRGTAPSSVLVYASSSKVFGPDFPSRVSESSLRRSTCIYTITKNAATELITYYRGRHNLLASVVWTFNHESPRRSKEFFIPRIVQILSESIRDRSFVAQIGALDFWSDWGDADEYMDIVAAVACRAPGKDLVLATGETLWAREFVNTLFQKYGLRWDDHLTERFPAQDPSGRPLGWHVDLSALSAAAGVTPTRTIYDVADDILRVNHPSVWESFNVRPLP